MGRANHQSTPVCARVGTYAVQSLSEAEVAGGARGLAAVSGNVNHRDNPRLWIDHNQAKNVVRRTCRAQRRRSQCRACREEPFFVWRDSPHASGCLWRRCRGQEAPRRVRERDASGRTALVIAAQGSHKEVVEAFLEHEKGMSDNQNHSTLLGSQEWAHRGRQDRHSPRGPN
ncbi:Cytochrome p450(bm-3) / nadph-cytochrome p450 reductase [Giardia duodenalis]|uniref:Cytochrome p450(Bm-3) / nadph-cytochrome p450 reductase n=1 Tax=Giardia intestinalis TaxID=5741 RepID=V6TNS2_GIAIN|nr:Cytochrome p450(bm-3) / nadph-cytochrome p450 reductase [Giardia intestinalis]